MFFITMSYTETFFYMVSMLFALCYTGYILYTHALHTGHSCPDLFFCNSRTMSWQTGTAYATIPDKGG